MPRYARNTSVPVDRSKAEIERTLNRYGATHFIYGTEPGWAVIGFTVRTRTIKLRLKLPAPDAPNGAKRARPGTKAAENAYAQEVRQRWRALALVIKAKLEAVEAGIATFEDEWLAYFLLPDGSTVSEALAPQLQATGPLLLTLRPTR